ncbi:MAG TPA: SIR2 family protein [Pyrinomonadaceae bacterium]|jgi:tetratricopeptide (TPR) repeat protein
MDLPKNLVTLDYSRLVFLCGAGISYDFPANLPTVNRFVFDVLKACQADSYIIKDIENQINTNQITSRFEVLIDEIRKLNDPLLKVGKIFDSKAFNKNHYFLAQMLLRGASVLTTNFDTCIENALKPQSVKRVIFTGKDLFYHPPYSQVLIKVHGSNSVGRDNIESNLIISIKALAATAQGFARFPKWREYLKKFLNNKIIIVWGYSGSDEFDVRPVMIESSPEHILWVDYSSKYSRPKQLPTTTNPKVFAFAKTLPLTYFQGAVDTLVTSWATQLPISLKVSRNKRPRLSIKGYINSYYASACRKEELINAVLLNYSLYEQVINRPLKGHSTEIIIQKMKALYRLGRANEARILFEKHKRRFRSISQLIQALYYYSAALYQLSEFEQAILIGEEQLSLAKKSKDAVSIIHSLNNLGGIYSTVGKYQKSKTCFERSLRKQKFESSSIEGEATAWWGLGNIACIKGQFENAYNFYRKAQQIYTELGSTYNLNYINLNIGVALTGLGIFDEAEQYLKIAETAFRELLNMHGLIFVLNALSKLYYQQKKLDKCAVVVSEAIEIIKEYSVLPIASEIALTFVALHLKKKDTEKVLNKYLPTFEFLIKTRQDNYAKLLRKVMKDNFHGRNLEKIERLIFNTVK